MEGRCEKSHPTNKNLETFRRIKTQCMIFSTMVFVTKENLFVEIFAEKEELLY